jgi:hypothetical protein
MRTRNRLSMVLFTAAAVVACGSSSSGGGGSPAGGHCVQSADCGSGEMCGFKSSDGCSAAGACFPAPAPGTVQCQSYVPACSCAGTLVNTVCNGYPSGYASAPVLHVGTCGDAG